MRSYIALTLAFFAALTLVLGVASGVAFASQPGQGFVLYSVTLSGQAGGQSNSFTVNESVSQTNQKGFDDIGLAISSADTNLSISKILNVSSLPEIFPYLPGINGSYSFESHGMSISASIQNSGTSSVSFNGKSYQVTNYEVVVSATNSTSGESGSFGGVLASMPSGLVYSAQVKLNNTYSADVQLLATNLPLLVSSSSVSSTTIGVAIVGASVFGAVVLAAPTLFKRAKKTGQGQDGAKPDYWVD